MLKYWKMRQKIKKFKLERIYELSLKKAHSLEIGVCKDKPRTRKIP